MTVGVLFGGPSPEHDISILTGLLALRELHRVRGEALGVYWTKAGDFFQVDAATEAEAFLEGVPSGSSALSLRLGKDGGFYTTGGRLTKERRLDVDAVIMATHGGPGRTELSRVPSISRASPTAAPPWRARRSGWTSGPLAPWYARPDFHRSRVRY